MFDSHKTVKRTVEAPCTVYTALSSELDRMHALFNSERERRGNTENNLNVYWNRIKEIQDILLECAKKGADEDLQAKVEDLQKHAAESILAGGA